MAWWQLPTNFTNNSGVNQSVDGAGDLFFSYPAAITGGKFMLGIILIIWVAVFGLSLAFGSKRALLTASFVTFFFSTLLAVGGWLNPVIPVIMIILVIVSAIASKSDGGL